jgi:acid phosphatase class B
MRWDNSDAAMYVPTEELSIEQIREMFGSSDEDIAKTINGLCRMIRLLQYQNLGYDSLR